MNDMGGIVLYNHTNEPYEIDYFDREDYEAARQKDSTAIHQSTVQKMEERFGCTYAEFILRAETAEEKAALQQWAFAIRYLARYKERIYV